MSWREKIAILRDRGSISFCGHSISLRDGQVVETWYGYDRSSSDLPAFYSEPLSFADIKSVLKGDHFQ